MNKLFKLLFVLLTVVLISGASYNEVEIQNAVYDAVTGTWKVKISSVPSSVSFTTSESGSSNSYLSDQTLLTLTTSYQTISFGFTARALILTSDCTNYLKFYFDVSTGTVKANEVVTLENIRQSSVSVRGESGNESYRLIVW